MFDMDTEQASTRSAPAGAVEWQPETPDEAFDSVTETLCREAREEHDRQHPTVSAKVKSETLGAVGVVLACQAAIIALFIIPWLLGLSTDAVGNAPSFCAFMSFSLASGAVVGVALLAIGFAEK